MEVPLHHDFELRLNWSPDRLNAGDLEALECREALRWAGRETTAAAAAAAGAKPILQSPGRKSRNNIPHRRHTAAIVIKRRLGEVKWRLSEICYYPRITVKYHLQHVLRKCEWNWVSLNYHGISPSLVISLHIKIPIETKLISKEPFSGEEILHLQGHTLRWLLLFFPQKSRK